MIRRILVVLTAALLLFAGCRQNNLPRVDGRVVDAVNQRLDDFLGLQRVLLPGIWRDCTGAREVGLVLAEDGSARAVGLGELPLQDWSLDEDNLVLTAVEQENPKSTRTLLFAIQKLDIDSLVVLPAGGGPALAFSRAE